MAYPFKITVLCTDVYSKQIFIFEMNKRVSKYRRRRCQ